MQLKIKTRANGEHEDQSNAAGIQSYTIINWSSLCTPDSSNSDHITVIINP